MKLTFLYHLQQSFYYFNLLFSFFTGNFASLTMLIFELCTFLTINQRKSCNKVKPLRLAQKPMNFEPVTLWFWCNTLTYWAIFLVESKRQVTLFFCQWYVPHSLFISPMYAPFFRTCSTHKMILSSSM